MSETTNQSVPSEEKLMPPGILSSESLPGRYTLPEGTLPWVDGPYEVSLVRCDVGDDTNFLLASVIGSHKRLQEAADAMTEKQSRNANNMFSSRIAAYMQHGQATSIDTFPKPVTDFAIHVMRNNGGQRVYFGVTNIEVKKGEPPEPVVLRLAAYDKNRQGQVTRLLTKASEKEQRQKMRKSK